jgi:hypothetical protein
VLFVRHEHVRHQHQRNRPPPHHTTTTTPPQQRSLDRFRANFAGQHDVHFPRPLWPLVNEFVLVEEYVGGTPISQILKDPACPVDEKRRIARSGLAAFLKMVFLDNFVHGDLHPGNIFVRESPRSKCVRFVGLVLALTCFHQSSMPRSARPAHIHLHLCTHARTHARTHACTHRQ